ncbi:hypothetical protein ACVGW7_17775, partial [Enterobacter intestinihominis]
PPPPPFFKQIRRKTFGVFFCVGRFFFYNKMGLKLRSNELVFCVGGVCGVGYYCWVFVPGKS